MSEKNIDFITERQNDALFYMGLLTHMFYYGIPEVYEICNDGEKEAHIEWAERKLYTALGDLMEMNP